MRLLFALALFRVSLFAALPDIKVDNLTGSDTNTSGAPFSISAVVGTCDTNGVASMVIDYTGASNDPVPVDGSGLLWMETPSGRRFSKVTAKTMVTYTVEDSMTIAAGGVACAVGGVRQTLSATRMFDDLRNGWGVLVVNTGTDYTHTTSLTGNAQTNFPRVWWRPDTGRVRLVWTTNVPAMSNGNNYYIENFDFVNTSGTKTLAFVFGTLASGYSRTLMRDCLVDGWGSITGGNAGTQLTWYRVEVKNSVAGGFATGATTSGLLLASYVHNNSGGDGLDFDKAMALYNLIANNTGDDGIQDGVALIHNTVYGHGADGLEMGAALAGYMSVGNLITNNTGFGVNSAVNGSDPENGRVVNNNAYFSNTAGTYNQAVVGANDTTGVNPLYVNAAGQNWAIGTPLSQLGWPPSTLVAGIGSATNTFTEPGASQRQGGAGAAHYAY